MLILAIAENFNKLFENRGVAAITPLSELRGIVVVTIYIALMLIVRVLSTEHSRTNGAREVLDVIFAVQSSNIRTPKSTTAIMAKEI